MYEKFRDFPDGIFEGLAKTWRVSIELASPITLIGCNCDEKDCGETTKQSLVRIAREGVEPIFFKESYWDPESEDAEILERMTPELTLRRLGGSISGFTEYYQEHFEEIEAFCFSFDGLNPQIRAQELASLAIAAFCIEEWIEVTENLPDIDVDAN